MGVQLTNGPALKKAVLALPEADWRESGNLWWESLLIVPTRKMHDSGFARIAIIGVNAHQAEQILGYPDDIQWPAQSGISGTMPDYGALRTDAYWPSGLLHLWSREYEFNAHGVSSLDIKIRRVAS